MLISQELETVILEGKAGLEGLEPRPIDYESTYNQLIWIIMPNFWHPCTRFCTQQVVHE